MARIPALAELAALFREPGTGIRGATADESKAVTLPATAATFLMTPGQPLYQKGNIENYIKYGFKKNVYLYRGVMILASAIAAIDWHVYTKGATGKRGTIQGDKNARVLSDH